MREAVVGIILAGGQSRRMGGQDKGILPLRGKPLLAWIIERARPQTQALALSANGDPAHYRAFGLPVATDSVAGFAGPLAGILAGLDWAAREHSQATHVATFPCDAPFFPSDLVAKLAKAARAENLPIACAASGGRAHPVFGLWSVSLREALRRSLIEEKLHKVASFMHAHGVARVEFPNEPFDPFFNINRQEDLIEAEILAARSPS